MAPRARGRPRGASQSGGQATPVFDSLPDAIVGDIMLQLPFEERRSLARVCRRWRQLVDSPELLRSVSVQLEATDPHDRSCSSDEDGSDSEGGGWFDGCSDDPEAPIRHILGFFDWLEQRAAPHVERLTVELGRLAFVLDFQMGCEESVTSALCHTLKACTRLQHFSLFMECSLQLYISDDLAPAAQAQLRSLAVECINDNGPEQPASLQVAGLLALTALESLHLLGNQVVLGTPPGLWRPLPLPPLPQPTDGLPPSLTSLALDGFVDFASSVQQFVPPQITALTNLQRLTLANLPGCSLSSLAALSSLTGLHLQRCVHLPTCLPHLPQLRTLRLEDSPFGLSASHDQAAIGAALAELGSALQQLAAVAAAGPQLRHLVLEDVRKLPPELAALPHLESLYWVEGYEYGGPATQLPACGPYLSSLRRLAIPSSMAAGSTAVLSAMPRLEVLALQCPASRGYGAAIEVAAEARVLEWVAQQRPPSLRRLALAFDPAGRYWAKYKRPMAKLLARAQLPPSLTVELDDALLRELRLG